MAYIKAGLTRLELAASCVTGRRSNQLNYNPDYKFGIYYISLIDFFCNPSRAFTLKMGGTGFEPVPPCV